MKLSRCIQNKRVKKGQELPLKTSLPFQEERGDTFKMEKISWEENAGNSWEAVDQFG